MHSDSDKTRRDSRDITYSDVRVDDMTLREDCKCVYTQVQLC